MEIVKQLKLRTRATNGIMQTKSPSFNPPRILWRTRVVTNPFPRLVLIYIYTSSKISIPDVADPLVTQKELTILREFRSTQLSWLPETLETVASEVLLFPIEMNP